MRDIHRNLNQLNQSIQAKQRKLSLNSNQTSYVDLSDLISTVNEAKDQFIASLLNELDDRIAEEKMKEENKDAKSEE